ncbi:MAG: GNAT family N-acetyltransferase [Muribaculaceae bacterium]|nr:GNAT family N-acetyltransferase [Muribaculaceae bacterium]MCI9055258.1 GNAT family N-acetyltransferase [Muribaculaceae bacterium]
MKIIPARKTDAPAIARTVMMAVGDEISLSFAGTPDRLPLVTEVFTRLAESENSQYSYTNTLVALTPEGKVAGAIVSYDGAELHRLRREFISVANEVLGMDMREEEFTDETSSDEVYLDSLCVFPEYRGQKLAGRLIEAACRRHVDAGKPVGLLVDPDNPRARRLYESLGFREVGQRPFAGVMMHHMQLMQQDC